MACSPRLRRQRRGSIRSARRQLHRILTVDTTGEPLWPYGAEDVAGDGLATFQALEQSVDIRSAYVATDATRFLVRAYVSSTTAVSPSDTVYVFIDTDNDSTTGGSANAPDVNPKFTTDPTNGGYELIIGIHGTPVVCQIWQWNNPTKAFVGAVPDPTLARAETGTDADPLRILTPVHGYLQAAVDLSLLPGLTPACSARMFLRSADDSGIADLNVGTIEPCVAIDNNKDGFPDVVPVPIPCMSDGECPGGGLCINNSCVLPEPCVVDTDCKATEQCVNDSCVPKPGGACTKNTDCAGLVCDNAVCTACVQGAGDLVWSWDALRPPWHLRDGFDDGPARCWRAGCRASHPSGRRRAGRCLCLLRRRRRAPA